MCEILLYSMQLRPVCELCSLLCELLPSFRTKEQAAQKSQSINQGTRNGLTGSTDRRIDRSTDLVLSLSRLTLSAVQPGMATLASSLSFFLGNTRSGKHREPTTTTNNKYNNNIGTHSHLERTCHRPQSFLRQSPNQPGVKRYVRHSKLDPTHKPRRDTSFLNPDREFRFYGTGNSG